MCSTSVLTSCLLGFFLCAFVSVISLILAASCFFFFFFGLTLFSLLFRAPSPCCRPACRAEDALPAPLTVRGQQWQRGDRCLPSPLSKIFLFKERGSRWEKKQAARTALCFGRWPFAKLTCLVFHTAWKLPTVQQQGGGAASGRCHPSARGSAERDSPLVPGLSGTTASWVLAPAFMLQRRLIPQFPAPGVLQGHANALLVRGKGLRSCWALILNVVAKCSSCALGHQSGGSTGNGGVTWPCCCNGSWEAGLSSACGVELPWPKVECYRGRKGHLER